MLLQQGNYLRQDTIAAIATPVGGAIAVVRLSGPRAFEVTAHLSRTSSIPRPSHAHLKHVQLYLENGQPLDDAMVVCFKNPKTYTGEDLVEFHTHGGAFIVRRLMETLLQLGVQQALPGEFSFRAVRNGKMTLFQAQAVADLIQAKTDSAIGLAMEKLTGQNAHQISQIAKDLRNIASLSELGIDFADQDIEEVSLNTLKARAQTILKTLHELEKSFDRGLKIQEGIKVVFAGLPNAGKSSLFNALLGEDRSIVSEIEGTTRDIIGESISLRGSQGSVLIRLEDTAGLRTTLNPIEKMGILRTEQALLHADLILFIADPNSDLEALQKELQNLSSKIPQMSQRTIGILTKADLPSKQLKVTLNLFSQFGIQHSFLTSTQTGEGLLACIDGMIHLAENWTRRETGEVLLTRLDHLEAVRHAQTHLKRGLLTSEIELFTSDLRQSLLSLSPLIGETVPDDILEEIFSRFCIGK